MVKGAIRMEWMSKTIYSTLLSVIFVMTLAGLAIAAGGDLDWSYSSATTGKQDVRAAAFDSAGNTILVGVDGVSSASNWFVAKVKADGSGLAWATKTFDMSGGIDEATAVVVDHLDNIIVSGTVHNGADFDIHTIKYNSAGVEQWQHTYDATGGDDYAKAVSVDSSNNVYVGGQIYGSNGNDDFVVVRYQASGPVNDEPLWVTPINGSDNGHDRLSALAVNTTGLAVTGESESATPGDFNFFVHKLNFDGTFAWFGGPQIYSDTGNGMGHDIVVDGNGDVIATGYVDDGTRAMYTAKYASADGSQVWAKKSSGDTTEGGQAIAFDSNNDIFVTGTSYTASTSFDVHTVKYQGADPVGGVPVELWSSPYNTVNGNHDAGLALQVDSGGDLFVAAYSNDLDGNGDDSFLTLKFSGDDGAMLWPDNTIYALDSLNNRPVAIGIGATGNILVGGWTDTAANNYDLLVLSYDPGSLDPPTNLNAAVLTNTSVRLTWTDNSEPPNAEDNFVVARRAEGEPDFTELAPALAAGTTTFDDTGLTPDTRYYYKVKATSAADGSSAWSSTVNIRTTVISYAAPTWLHLYAGTAAGDDEARGIATGADQHPVVTGSSYAGVLDGGHDYLTIKLDRADDTAEQWTARYNDGDNNGDYGTSVVVDSQNRVVVTGYASLFGGGGGNTNDVYTVGYAADGLPKDGSNTLSVWDDQYNGPDGDDDKSSAVAVATDGSDNTVVIGYGKNASFNNDIYVIKFDPDGNRLWAATPYDGGGEDYPASVAFDSSGNVFVVGNEHNGTDDDWFVARYAAVDGAQTHKAPLHAFAGNGTDYAKAVVVDDAGDVYVTGYAFNGSSGDIYTVKYSGTDLSILWQQPDDSGGYDLGADIDIDPISGEVLVAGTSFMGASNHDFRLIRYAAAGNAGAGDEIWNHRVDMSGTDDSVEAMAVDNSGVAILTGTSDDDILTVKIDHNETIVGANVFDGAANDVDYPADVAVNMYGEAFVAGTTMNGDAVPNNDYVVFMADGDVVQAPYPFTAMQLYSEISLSWADNDLNGTGFELERKDEACSGVSSWHALATLGGGVTAYVDGSEGTVSANTTYCYRIKTTTASDSSRWAELEVTTSDPQAPSGLNADLLNDTDIELSWTDNTTDASDYEFLIERCSGASCDFSSSTQVVVSAVTVTDSETGVATWIDSTACSGSSYRYQVLARKPGLWASPFSTPTDASGVSPQSPVEPSGLTADRVSETLVDLSWADNSDGETGFLIERCNGNAGDCASGSWSPLNTLNTIDGNIMLMRMDEAAWDGTTDEVTDLSGHNNHGTATSMTTDQYGRYGRGGLFDGNYDNIATSLVIDQSATSTGATFVAWVKPTDNGGGNRYLFHTDDGGNDWSLLQVGSSWQLATGVDAALQDTGVVVDPGSWQHLAVSFDPALGVKLYKNGSLAYSDAGIDTDASSSSLVLGVQANGEGKIAFQGFVDEVSVFSHPLNGTDVTSLYQHGVARYRDTSIVLNNDYTYRVSAVKPGSCGSDWPTATTPHLSVLTSPPAPDLTVIPENIGRSRLEWVTHTTTHDGFKVERCVGGGCSPSTVLYDAAGADVTQFVDDTTCAGNTYRYQVKATDAGWGESTPSNIEENTIPGLAASTNLVQLDITEGHATLSWDYPNPDASGFKVGFCETSGSCVSDGDFTIYNTTGLFEDARLMLHMDESSWSNGSNDILDSSGENNHATSYSGAEVLADGYYGWAGSFDGVNDYVTTPVVIDQTASGGGATFEAWVYPTVQDTSWRFLLSTENGGNDWGVMQYNGLWYFSNGSSWRNTGIAATLNTWQHIAVTFDPNVATIFYKNGGQVPSDIYTYAQCTTDSSTNPLAIGRRANGSYHFAGRVDEVAVYQTVMSAQQVLDRYNGKRYAISGILTPETNYTFRTWAYRDDSCNSRGASVDYTDPVITTTEPVSAVSGLTATDFGTTQVDLAWTVETTSENLLRVERCTGTSLACGTNDANFVDFSAFPVTLSAATSGYSDETVCAESDYTYRVRAERDTAPTWESTWVYVERPSQTLPVITGLSATGISESEVQVVWEDETDDESVFTLERCPDNDFSCGSPAVLKTESASSLIYHFDEAAWVNGVADVLDNTDNGLDGTSYSGANTIEQGRFGRGGDFSAASDYLTSPLNIDQSSGSNGVTLQAWAYPTTNDSNYKYVISTDNGGADWSIYLRYGNWYIMNGQQYISVNATVDMNEWQHVAAVFEPGVGVRFYKNGVETYTSSTIYYDTSDASVTIGRRGTYSNTIYNFIGLIDEVVVTEKPLSGAEILANFDQPYMGFNDESLVPGNDYSYKLSVTKDVTLDNPDGCNWTVSAVVNTATLAPPAPEQFEVDTKTTTSVDLSWIDKSGSETDYQFQRCADTLVNCAGSDLLYNTATFPSVDLPSDTQGYSDDCAEVDTDYSYRVRARKEPYVPPGWNTDWVYLETRTEAIAPLTNFEVNRISEVHIDIEWDDANSDETGFILERCSGSGCDFTVKDVFTFSDPSSHVVYSDDELEPGQSYRYRARGYKTVACTEVDDWYTTDAGPLEASSSIAVPNLLSANEVSTTQIDLTFTTNAPSGTGVVVERCNGNPCSDSYTEVGMAEIGASVFADTKACQSSTYTYRIKNVGEGLSGNGEGCWNRRSKVNFTTFEPDSRFELIVPYDGDMRADFADLRFFDETAKRELTYWIAEKTNGSTATVYLHTAANDNVYMYYGNPDATDAGRKDEFSVYYDDFSGNQIDTDIWYDLDVNNYIVQNDGLHLNDVVINGNWSGLVSKDTYQRSDELEVLFEVSLPDDTDGGNYFSLGWYKDQTTLSTSYFAHQVYWYNNTEFRAYENGTAKDPGSFRYYPNNDYTVKVVADTVDGARYYVIGGDYANWTLITDTTADGNRYNGSSLRLGIMQQSEEVTINSVWVRNIIIPGVTSLAAEEDNGGSCFSPGYAWESSYSTEDVWETTRAAVIPTLDSVTVVDDKDVKLTWTNNTDADALFDVYRSGCSVAGTIATDVAGTTYTDTSAPSSSTCDYYLHAVKDTATCSWDVGPSNVVSADTFAASPTNLVATAENSRLVKLTWTNNSAFAEDGFEIQVKYGNNPYMTTTTLVNAPYPVEYTVGVDGMLYYDGRNVESGRTYNYRVRSYQLNDVDPNIYEWSQFAYSNPVSIPAFNPDDTTCWPPP